MSDCDSTTMHDDKLAETVNGETRGAQLLEQLNKACELELSLELNEDSKANTALAVKTKEKKKLKEQMKAFMDKGDEQAAIAITPALEALSREIEALKQTQAATNAALKKPTKKVRSSEPSEYEQHIATAGGVMRQSRGVVDPMDELVPVMWTTTETVYRLNPDGTQTAVGSELVTHYERDANGHKVMRPRREVFDSNGVEHASVAERMNHQDFKDHNLMDIASNTDFDPKPLAASVRDSCQPGNYYSELKNVYCCMGTDKCLCYQSLESQNKIKNKNGVGASIVMPAATYCLKLLVDELTQELPSNDPFCVALRESNDPIEKIFKDHYINRDSPHVKDRSESHREHFFDMLYVSLSMTKTLVESPSQWAAKKFCFCECYSDKSVANGRPRNCITESLNEIAVNNQGKDSWGLKLSDKLIPAIVRLKKDQPYTDYGSGKDEDSIWYGVFTLFDLMAAALEDADQAYVMLREPGMEHLRGHHKSRIDKYKHMLMLFKVVVNFTVAQNRDRIKSYKQSHVFASVLMTECDFCPIKDDGKTHDKHPFRVFENLRQRAFESVSLVCNEYFYRRLEVGNGVDTALRCNPFNPNNYDIAKLKEQGEKIVGGLPSSKQRLADYVASHGVFQNPSEQIQFVKTGVVGKERTDNMSSFITQVVRRYFGASPAKVAWMAICMTSQMHTQWEPEHTNPISADGRCKPKVLEAEHRRFWDVDQVHKVLGHFVLNVAGELQKVGNRDPKAFLGGKRVPPKVYMDTSRWRQFDKATRREFKDELYVGTVMGNFKPAEADKERWLNLTVEQKYDELARDEVKKYQLVPGPRLSTEIHKQNLSGLNNQNRTLEQQRETIAAIACMVPHELLDDTKPNGPSLRVQRWTLAYDLLGWFATQRGGRPVRFLDPVMVEEQRIAHVLRGCSLKLPLQGYRALDREIFPDPLYAIFSAVSKSNDAIIPAKQLYIESIPVVTLETPLCIDPLVGSVARAIKHNDTALSILNPVASSLVDTLKQSPTAETLESAMNLPQMQMLIGDQVNRDIVIAELYMKRLLFEFGGQKNAFTLVAPEGWTMALVLAKVGSAKQLDVDNANRWFGSITESEKANSAQFVHDHWDKFESCMRLFHSLSTKGLKLAVEDHSLDETKIITMKPVWHCTLGSRFVDYVSRLVKMLDNKRDRNIPQVIKTLAKELVHRQSAKMVEKRNTRVEKAEKARLEGTLSKREKRDAERARDLEKREAAMARAAEKRQRESDSEDSDDEEEEEEEEQDSGAGQSNPDEHTNDDEENEEDGDKADGDYNDEQNSDGCISDEEEEIDDMEVDAGASAFTSDVAKPLVLKAAIEKIEKNLDTYELVYNSGDFSDEDELEGVRDQHKAKLEQARELAEDAIDEAGFEKLLEPEGVGTLDEFEGRFMDKAVKKLVKKVELLMNKRPKSARLMAS